MKKYPTKTIFTLLIALLGIQGAFAQVPSGASTITGKISGVIIDSLTQKPVDYATVGLGRSGSTKTTNGSLSDEKGVLR